MFAVFLAEPQRTPWDLNFSFLGFPVRVHPMFWLFGLLISGSTDPMSAIIGLVVYFGSILLHELGHALMMRRFGRQSYIVLYMLGGLAIEGSPNPYETYYHPRSERRTPAEQIYISLAGPGIQFLLAFLIVVFVKSMGEEVRLAWFKGIMPMLFIEPSPSFSPQLYLLLASALWINTWWPLLNLLPVFPLDGGQVAMAALTMRDPWAGQQRALQLGIGAGVAMAVFALVIGSTFTAIMFGSLAYSNYAAYSQIIGRGGRGW
jgi:Zn-dependent protease